MPAVGGAISRVRPEGRVRGPVGGTGLGQTGAIGGVSEPGEHRRRIAAVREEMRFEIGVFHDRVNGLISAEAFLLISFTMALTYAGPGSGAGLFWISPTLAVIGLTLAVLAWPGILASHKIIEWNVVFLDVVNAAHAASAIDWRPSVFADGDRRTQADHRRGLLFARFVPLIFVVAWAVLGGLVLVSRRT